MARSAEAIVFGLASVRAQPAQRPAIPQAGGRLRHASRPAPGLRSARRAAAHGRRAQPAGRHPGSLPADANAAPEHQRAQHLAGATSHRERADRRCPAIAAAGRALRRQSHIASPAMYPPSSLCNLSGAIDCPRASQRFRPGNACRTSPSLTRSIASTVLPMPPIPCSPILPPAPVMPTAKLVVPSTASFSRSRYSCRRR